MNPVRVTCLKLILVQVVRGQPQQPRFSFFDQGLWMPNKTFFHRNLKFWGLNRLFGRINFGAFGVFLADLSVPILVLWVSFPCFPSINHYFLKKSRLYIQITIIHLGLRLESGPQRIKGFSHLVFVVHAFGGFTSFFVHFFFFLSWLQRSANVFLPKFCKTLCWNQFWESRIKVYIVQYFKG